MTTTFNNALNANEQGVQYQSTTGVWTGIDASDATYVLTSNGTGVAPSFQVAPSGSGTTIGPYIVGPTNSDYTDIQSAINAAVTAGASASNPLTIYIQSGTYTISASYTFGYTGTVSNALVLQDGISLVGVTQAIAGVNSSGLNIAPVTINADYLILDNELGVYSGAPVNNLQNINFTSTVITPTDYVYSGSGLGVLNINGCSNFVIGYGTNVTDNSTLFYVSGSNFLSINYYSYATQIAGVSIQNSTCGAVSVNANGGATLYVSNSTIGDLSLGGFGVSAYGSTIGTLMQQIGNAQPLVFDSCNIGTMSSSPSITFNNCSFSSFTTDIPIVNFNYCNFSGNTTLGVSNTVQITVVGGHFSGDVDLNYTNPIQLEQCYIAGNLNVGTSAAVGLIDSCYVGGATSITVAYTPSTFSNSTFIGDVTITTQYGAGTFDIFNCLFSTFEVFNVVGSGLIFNILDSNFSGSVSIGSSSTPSVTGISNSTFGSTVELHTSGSVPIFASSFASSLTLDYDGANTGAYIFLNCYLPGTATFDGYMNGVFQSCTIGTVVLNGSGVNYANCVTGSVEINSNPMTIGAYTLPNTDGSPNQFLQTDGSGNVTWESVGTVFPLQLVNSTPWVSDPVIEYYYSVDTSSIAITIQLPDAPSQGKAYVVKDNAGNSSTNNITITTVSGADTFDGATSVTLANDYGAAQFIFNGANWEIF